jgi:hypothetical protein
MKVNSWSQRAPASRGKMGVQMKVARSIKIITRITIALILCSYVIGVSGQTRREESSGGAGCIKKYDRFRNRNTVTLTPQTVHKVGMDELKLGASAVLEGEDGTAPKEIDLLFDSTTSRLRYGNSAEVRFIVDGKRVDGGTAYKVGGEAMRQVNEKLRLTMTASRFLEVFGGREVAMQIGETEVTLQREDVQRMRAFATCAGLRASE